LQQVGFGAQHFGATGLQQVGFGAQQLLQPQRFFLKRLNKPPRLKRFFLQQPVLQQLVTRGAQHFGAAGLQHFGAAGLQQDGATVLQQATRGAQHFGAAGLQQVGLAAQHPLLPRFIQENRPASAEFATLQTNMAAVRVIHFISSFSSFSSGDRW
jgi:hypothetical protein